MSQRQVVVVDYGIGNLLSVSRALAHCDASVNVSGDEATLMHADRLVLPGVGAFGDCMAALEAKGLHHAVREFAATGRPILGICVGMQVLLDESEEFGVHHGLGFVAGRVEAIPVTTAEGLPHKIPHIGWAGLHPPVGRGAEYWHRSVLQGIVPGASAYFVHSFTAKPVNEAARLADSFYNGRVLAAAIHKDNVVGTQFHPEKSGITGLTVLKNFLSI